jgi:Ca-activated chloride channel family protein
MRAHRMMMLLPLLVGFDLLESPNRAVEEGNARLKAGKAEEALGHYDKAVHALPAEPGVHFDRGAALFSLGRFDESVQEFLRATEAKSTPLKAAAFYNLGNGLFKTEKYGDAVAAYRRALVLDPGDVRAKWNLELALKKKKEQEDKQKQKDQKNDKDDKQSKNDKQKQDQKNGGQQGKQDQKDQGKQDQQAKQDQPKPDQQAKKEQEQPPPQPDKEKDKDQGKQESPAAEGQPPGTEKAPDMKEIEAVLDSLERSPKDLEQERARLRAVRRAPPRKDW